MNIEDLKNPLFISCLKELSENDINRLTKLKTDGRYVSCIDYMLENNVKLEQEIASYLEKE